MALTKRIIPCLDVDKGQIVKGVRFLGRRDAGDPVSIARGYDEQGADELVLLDISASRERYDIMARVVQAVASQVFIPITVGGGIRSSADIARMLRAGADKVAVNTAAVLHPELLDEAALRFGTQCIVAAIDVKRVGKTNGPPRWEVYTHGGRKPSGLDAMEWAQRAAAAGVGEILLTSMDKDGTKAGFDLELTRAVSEGVSVPVIAAGGVGTLEHLYQGLHDGRADAVIATSIFHLGRHSVGDAKQYLFQRGINVRL